VKNIVFLVSGNGGTLKFLYHAIKQLDLDLEIGGIIADRDCSALDFAKRNNLINKQIKYNKNYSAELQMVLENLSPDLIVTNIHKIIDAETINRYPGKFINLHYSLLPAFSGLIGMETVSKAKEQNVGFIGGTCHYVNEQLDAGKIIQQGCFAVDWSQDLTAVDTLFKTACICLLGSMMKIFDFSGDNTNQIIFNNTTVNFSPVLQFNPVFDDKF